MLTSKKNSRRFINPITIILVISLLCDKWDDVSNCIVVWTYIDIVFVFFLLLVSITGEVSGRLVASWLQKSEMENEWKFWLKMIFLNFHFIHRFDIHPNTYSAISIVNFHKICNIEQKYTSFFSFLAKCILVLLAQGEKSSKLLADSNRFPSFKPLFSKFLSRFLIKLATSNNSNF